MQINKYLGLFAMAALLACNNGNKSATAETADSTALVNADTVSVAALDFKDEKLKHIYSAYIGLKDQLVATKFEEAKQHASELATALKDVVGCENAALIAQKITDAADIKTQRAVFTGLNVELIPVFKQAELTSGTIYVQHCPMANNGDGGDWLASEEKIQNPYYGDEMMECGRVAEKINAKK
ncbi:DUF3347 domain-containing protein [Pedobacter sp. UBA4863]|uniref:DUF3347 domain-containing protein n=1 Tax=Pedobacter sp. UBA4863 TaxID=1947060 RepID=UPI0025F6B15F|nr:DUF3347 domain-containing protein [Pedobacter sp. UBA4863]